MRKWILLGVGLGLATAACGGNGRKGPGSLSIVSTVPSSDASGAEVFEPAIEVQLDHDVAASSIFDADIFTVSDGQTNVAGATSIVDVDRVSFAVQEPLTLLQTYTGHVESLLGTGGEVLAEPYEWSFTTRDGQWSGLEPVGVGSFVADPDSAPGPLGALATWSGGSPSNIFAAVHQPYDGWTEFWRVDDSDAAASQTPRVVQGPDGEALIIWRESAANIQVFASHFDPVSRTWTAPVRIDGTNLGNANFLTLRVTGDRAIATWIQDHDNNGLESTFAAIYNFTAGQWGAALRVDTNDAEQSGFPDGVLRSDGTAVAVWNQFDGNIDSVYANTFDGNVWSTPVPLENDAVLTHDHAQVVADSAENVMAVWEGGDGVRGDLYFSQLSAGASSWTAADMAESEATANSERASLTVTPNDDVVMVWQHAPDANGNADYTDDPVHLATARFSGGSWGALAQVDDNGGGNVFGSDLAVDPRGNILAVWQQGGEVLTARAVGGTWGAAVPLDSPTFADQVSLTTGESGAGVVLWTAGGLLSRAFE